MNSRRAGGGGIDGGRAPGSLSFDMDTVRSLCGVATRSPEPAWTVGLKRVLDALDRHRAKATFFVVGRDGEDGYVAERWRELVERGHEVAVHTWSHPQAWPALARDRKREEILKTADIVERVTGSRPVGFRAPGWNVDEETLEILGEEGFLYDSSVFPTSLAPVLKLAYGWATRFRLPTLGRLSFVRAPRQAYYPGRPLWRERDDRDPGTRLLEIPLSVTPGQRRPVFSTWYLWRGTAGLAGDLEALAGEGVNFMFHPADFLDASEVAPLLSGAPAGTYIPAGLTTSWDRKEPIVSAMIAEVARRFRPLRLRDRIDDPAA